MAAQSALQQHFAANLAALSQAKSSRSFLLIFATVFGATILVIGLASFVSMVLVTGANAVGAFAGTAGVPTLIAACVGAAIRQHRRREARSLAALPMVFVDERDITAHCARCGARVAPHAGDVATTCCHCGTRGLLPRTMVEREQHGLHQRVLAARIRGEATTAAATDLNHAINAGVGDAFLLAGLAAIIGFGGYPFVAPVERYPQPHRFAMWFMAGLMTGGILAVFGGLTLHDAHQRLTATYRQSSRYAGPTPYDAAFRRRCVRWIVALVLGVLAAFVAALAGEFANPS